MPTEKEKCACRMSCKVSPCCWAGFALLVAAGAAGAALWLAGHHIVQTRKGVVIVPKGFVRMADTFVDIRAWKWDDAVARHDVSQALITAKHGDLLPPPPPEPSQAERMADAARHFGQEAKLAGSNVWQRVRSRASELKKDIKEDLHDMKPR